MQGSCISREAFGSGQRQHTKGDSLLGRHSLAVSASLAQAEQHTGCPWRSPMHAATRADPT